MNTCFYLFKIFWNLCSCTENEKGFDKLVLVAQSCWTLLRPRHTFQGRGGWYLECLILEPEPLNEPPSHLLWMLWGEESPPVAVEFLKHSSGKLCCKKLDQSLYSHCIQIINQIKDYIKPLASQCTHILGLSRLSVNLPGVSVVRVRPHSSSQHPCFRAQMAGKRSTI